MAKKTQKADKQEEIKDQQVEETPLEEQEIGEEEVDETAAEGEEQEDERSPEELLQEKLAELQDKYLRLTAEYDNYRRRTLKEKTELLDGAKVEVFVNLLPVVDDLERAMEAIRDAKELGAVQEGMELIYTKFTNYLNQQGVKAIDAVGEPLDTEFHEAVTQIPVEEKKKKGKVVDVIEKGYTLRERVIRFAKVIIGV